MKIVGQFFIQESFAFTKPSLVILGQLTEGSIDKGTHITINTGSGFAPLTINAIDYADHISIGMSQLALTFIYANKELKASLAGLKVTGQQVDIWAD